MTRQATHVQKTVANTAPGRPDRVSSLDVVRGVFLVVSVLSESVLLPRPAPLVHSAWEGVTAIDLVFPLFVTLSGCGLAFAYRRHVSWRRTLRRSVVLLAFGLVYAMIAAQDFSLDELKVTGPLQVYAVVVLVVGLLHQVARTARAWALITVIVASAQVVFLMLWQASCPGNELLPTCNPSRVIDFAVFGEAHVYALGALGHDPEGLPSILGALVTTCAGVTAGQLAIAYRNDRRAPLFLFAWAGALALAAMATAPALPTMKRLWTTPFALGAASLGIILLAVGIVILDRPANASWESLRAKVSWPLVALGRNSLLVYFGSHILIFILLQHGGETSWAIQLSGAVDVVGYPRASFMALMLAFWLVTAIILHRKKWYLRA